ncbi:hypothetical protein INR49_027216, partial [Caranx melampygus]
VSCEDLSPVQTEDFSSQGTTVTLSYNYAKKATGRVSCEDLSPVQTEDFSSQGTTVTLSYTFLKKGTDLYYFFWYRQYPGKPPEFLISHQESGELLSDPVSGLGTTLFICCLFGFNSSKDMLLYLFLLLSHFIGVSCEDLSPVQTEDFSSQGTTVTLSYNFSKKGTISYYFFWYRQYPGKPPEFLISHQESGELLSDSVSGLYFTVPTVQSISVPDVHWMVWSTTISELQAVVCSNSAPYLQLANHL